MTPRSNGTLYWKHAFMAATLITSAFLTGCMTTTPPQANLADPGWKFCVGQAAWKPSADEPLINGKVLLARNDQGDVFIRFDDKPLNFLRITSVDGAWQIERRGQTEALTGQGLPPEENPWFLLPEIVQEQQTAATLAGDWQLEASDPWTWALDNPSSGESIRMVFYE